MRITIGSTLLGDHTADIHVGGFSASATGTTLKGRGTSGGLQRLRDHGNGIATFSVPTKREFDTVSEAQKFINDTTKSAGYEGLLLYVYADGTETRFPWAVARPTSLTHIGVMVVATWSIEAGARLT